MINKSFRLLALVSVLLFNLGSALPATAGETENTQGFRKHVTLEGIREHQAAFQAQSDAAGGSRLAGTSGFDASAQYVYERMAAAGYNVSFQEFTFFLVSDRTPPVLQLIDPNPRYYIDGTDFQSMSYSGSGDYTASVTAVDLIVPSPAANASTSGCEASDFAGFPVGTIALMQRGTCTFRIKAENAVAAGAVGVIIFNEGTPGRTAVLGGTLGSPLFSVPTVGTSFAVGYELSNGILNGSTNFTVRLKTDTIAETRTTRNVIAESPLGDPSRVIVAGAHLDSVSRGPGINDNGSGSATLLEIAEVFAQQVREPRNMLRFMWFSAEEQGLVGSNYYVASLSQPERDRIELMLNFDMLNSPNWVRFVYDGDNSAFPVGPGVQLGPSGSGAIEQVFLDYFISQGMVNTPTPFSGRSDYGPFITAGIPAGGLFSGAEGTKTAQQAVDYGGVAGARYDACYHLACDTYTNVTTAYASQGFDQMADAAAHAILVFSKRNFDKEPLTDPALQASLDARASSAGPEADLTDEDVHSEAHDLLDR